MPMRLSRPFLLALLALAIAPGAAALGFGEMPQSVPFGQPLDVSIPLRLAAGETLASGCVSAHVELGERSLSKADVRVSAEPEATGSAAQRVRVRSALVVDEPVVTLLVSVGCGQRLTRQLVVFADPVEMSRTLAVPSPSAAEPVATVAPAPRAVRAAAAPAARVASADASAAEPPAAPRKTAEGRKRAPRREAAVAGRSASATPRVAAAGKAKAPASAPARAPAAPRLRLDPEDSAPDVAALAAAEQQRQLDVAVASALAAQAAAVAAGERVAGVERQLLALREAASADQAAMTQLRERLGRAQSQDGLLPLLGALLAVLIALVAWLAWRVHALQRARDAAWAGVLAADDAPALGEPGAEPAHDPQPRITEAPHRLPVSTPAALIEAVSADEVAAALELPSDEPPVPSSSRRKSGKNRTSLSNRQLSVEELIDLEQQAEFFCVLGQDESAIDLLMAHLRSSGGAQPDAVPEAARDLPPARRARGVRAHPERASTSASTPSRPIGTATCSRAARCSTTTM